MIPGTAGVPFTFYIDVESEKGEGWKEARKPARANNQSMDVSETEIVKSCLSSLGGKQERDEVERIPCEQFVQRL